MATGTTAQEMVDVVTPAAGESVTEGTILEWHVKVGDFIKLDDTIVEISTDKVDVELPSPASGTVAEILIEEGETVTVGQVIARISPGDAASSEGGASNGAEVSEQVPPSAAARAGDGRPEGVEAPPLAARAGDGGEGSPVAAPAAAAGGRGAEGVDRRTVSGSGPAGRITKADVLSVTANGTASPVAEPPAVGEAPAGAELLKGSAAALARYMEESRAIPTATSFRTVPV